MRCSTCGERLDATHRRCPTCGAAVAESRAPGGPYAGERGIPRCPRCGYRGDGVSYFRRPGHLAILVGLSIITYGMGGLVYWLLRRNAEVCPECGLRRDYGTARALPAGNGDGSGSEESEPLPRGGGARRVLGAILILAAVLLFGIGFVEWVPELFVVGGVAGTAGSLGVWWGLRAQNDRRQALAARMQRRVLQLAARSDGTLTVTEVAANLDLSLPAAEKVLMAMDDGFRVRSEITDTGVILYEFPEVQHRRRLEHG